MAVRRRLARGQCDCFAASGLSLQIVRETGSLALAQRYPAAQIRQVEGLHAVAAKERTDKRIQRWVVSDRQGLPLAQRPSDRSEIEPDEPDRPDKKITHAPAFSVISSRRPSCFSRGD